MPWDNLCPVMPCSVISCTGIRPVLGYVVFWDTSCTGIRHVLGYVIWDTLWSWIHDEFSALVEDAIGTQSDRQSTQPLQVV